MAALTLETARLELRRDEKGRFGLFFDGIRVPGVMEVDISQETIQRPVFTITFAAVAIRVIEHVPADPDVWKLWSGGAMPVPPETFVDVRFRGIAGTFVSMIAGCLSWETAHDVIDIVEWKRSQ